MLQFLRRRPRALHQANRIDFSTNPCARLLRLFLTSALDERATFIIFGVPAGANWNWEEAALAHERGMREGNSVEAAVLAAVRQSKTPAPTDDYEKKCAPLLVDGSTMSVPVWFEKAGTYQCMVPIPGGVYLSLLSMLDQLRVGIDYEGEPATSPHRYIELEPQPHTRRFAEVAVHLARDNTIRIELVGVRSEIRPLQDLRQ
jgi:hypothetical protein